MYLQNYVSSSILYNILSIPADMYIVEIYSKYTYEFIKIVISIESI